MANLQDLLTKLNLKVVEGTLGQNNKVITKLLGNEFWKPEINSIIKTNGGEFSVKYRQPEKYWFWWGDKNSNAEKIKKTLEGIIKKSNEMGSGGDISPDEVIAAIDDIINAMSIEEPSANPDLKITAEQENSIKEKLQAFKQRLVNIENDEDFKETMGKILALKSAQGYQFSLGNAILIMIQNPNAGIVNSRANWLEKYNRTVNANATPLMVWAPQGVNQRLSKDKEEKLKAELLKKLGKKPGDKLTPNEQFQLEKEIRGYTYASKFKFVPVFSQHDTTQIKDTEDYIKAAENSTKDIKWFEDNMISDEVRPIYKGLVDFTSEKNIKLEFIDDLNGARGSSASGAIKLLKNEGNDIGLTKTLAHEITHELLHQKYLFMKGDETAKFFVGTAEGRAAVEQQAELSAWMFMYAFGFDLKTTSLNYVLLWGGDKDKMIKVFDTVSNSVNYLIDFVNKKIKSLTEEMGTHTHGEFITPDDIAKVLGVEKQFKELEKQELKERILRKLNIIK